MEAVDKFESYGQSNVPDQGDDHAPKATRICSAIIPKLDFIKKATIEK